MSLNYNFNKDLWIKVLAQNNEKTKNNYVYGLLGWRFKPPFGALYLIYSHENKRHGGDPSKTNSFFLKFTYPIELFR